MEAKQRSFDTRAQFRKWLEENGQTEGGFWMLFGKPGGPVTLHPEEALEEALCFGWIDGQMQKLDEQRYLKYFAPRRKKSNWSEKNKKLVVKLEEQGRMTDAGRIKIEEAKADGSWEASKGRPEISDGDIAVLEALVVGKSTLAAENFGKMSPSVRKTYTGMYLDAKSEATRATRLEKIVARLEQNLKPM